MWQGNRDFSRYYADFTRLVNILGYNDEAKRDAQERGLSQEILDALRYESEPENETLAQYEARIKRLDDRPRRCKGLTSSRNPAPQNRQTYTKSNIKGAWRAIGPGIVPHNPDAVLTKLPGYPFVR